MKINDKSAWESIDIDIPIDLADENNKHETSRKPKKRQIKHKIVVNFSTISFLVIGTLLLYLLGLFISYKTREYKYVEGNYVVPNTIYIETIPSNQYKPSESELQLFEYAKKIVLESEIAKKYDFLDWDIVEKTQLYCGNQERDTRAVAQYVGSENTVYLFEKTHQEIDEMKIRIMIHELMHAATYRSTLKGCMKEALAEKLTYLILKQDTSVKVVFEYAYQLFVWEYNCFEVIWGDDLVKMIYLGEIEKIVDKYTKNGFYRCADNALSCGDNVDIDIKTQNNYIRIAQDEIVHFANAYCHKNFDKKSGSEKLKQIEEMLIIKEEYFTDNLNW